MTRSTTGRFRRREAPVVLVALLFALWAGASRAVADAGDPAIEQSVDRIARQVIAPCCFRNTVAEHDSPASHKVRAEIRALVEGGAGDEHVLDALAQRYGERILASPRASGFGVLAYLVPPLALFVAGGAIWRFVRAARRRRGLVDALPNVASRTADVDPALRARLDAELADLHRGAPPFAVRARAR